MHVRYTGDLRLYQSQLLLITSQKQVARFGAVAPNTEKSLECDGAQAQHHVDCRLRYKVSSGTKMMMELELKLIQTDERIAQAVSMSMSYIKRLVMNQAEGGTSG